MTPVVLLERLKEFIGEHTADIILKVRPVNNKTLPPPRPRRETAPPDTAAEVLQRAAEVHLMRLPDKDAETNRIPYVLLQYITGKDTQEPGEREDSLSSVRIIIATYSDNDSEGAMDVLNLITRIRNALLKAGIIGNQFLLRKPLEYLVYTDDTQPYFFGELMSVWEMPTVIREVHTRFKDD